MPGPRHVSGLSACKRGLRTRNEQGLAARSRTREHKTTTWVRCCVPKRVSHNIEEEKRRYVIEFIRILVRATGIEPVTPTMSR